MISTFADSIRRVEEGIRALYKQYERLTNRAYTAKTTEEQETFLILSDQVKEELDRECEILSILQFYLEMKEHEDMGQKSKSDRTPG